MSSCTPQKCLEGVGAGASLGKSLGKNYSWILKDSDNGKIDNVSKSHCKKLIRTSLIKVYLLLLMLIKKASS